MRRSVESLERLVRRYSPAESSRPFGIVSAGGANSTLSARRVWYVDALDVVLLAFGSLLAIALASSVQAVVEPTMPNTADIAGPFVLVGGIWLTASLTVRRTIPAVDWQRAAPGAIGVMALSSIASVCDNRLAGIGATQLVALLYSSAAEEMAFRATLPFALMLILKRSARAAPYTSLRVQVAAQLLFAIGHFGGSGSPVEPSISELLRLFAGGLSFAVIAATAGIASAILLHWFLNASLIFGAVPAVSPDLRHIATIAATALLALISLTLLDASRSRVERQVSRLSGAL